MIQQLRNDPSGSSLVEGGSPAKRASPSQERFSNDQLEKEPARADLQTGSDRMRSCFKDSLSTATTFFTSLLLYLGTFRYFRILSYSLMASVPANGR